jgi:hypothetical protein
MYNYVYGEYNMLTINFWYEHDTYVVTFAFMSLGETHQLYTRTQLKLTN